jgi:formylglycine-generating enzyme required for sulfatase activity
MGVGRALYPEGLAIDKPFSWFAAASDGSNFSALDYDSIYGSSPDGRRLLVRVGDEVQLIEPDGTNAVKLETEPDADVASVLWLSSGSFAFATGARASDGVGSLYFASQDGAHVTKLSKPASEAGQTSRLLFASADEDAIYWVTGSSCEDRGVCQERYFFTKLDDSEQRRIWENIQSAGSMIYPSPSREFITYFQYFGWSIKNGCTLATIDAQPLSSVELEGSSSCGSWSPVDDRLYLRGFTKIEGGWETRYVVWDEPGNRVTNLPPFNAGYCRSTRWTPDGTGIFLSGCIEKYTRDGKWTEVGSRLIGLLDAKVTEYPDDVHCRPAVSPDSKWALLYACTNAQKVVVPSRLLNLEKDVSLPVFTDLVSDDPKALETGWEVRWLPAAGAELPIPAAEAAATAAPAESLQLGSARLSPGTNMVQLYIPAGEFVMGTDAEVSQPNARPEHTVKLDAYWIDQTEVTNRMYMACIGAGECTPPAYGDPGQGVGSIGAPWKRQAARGFLADQYDSPAAADLPVVNVSWEQASGFCHWAGGELPTEAQWEKAARGSDARPFPWGTIWPPTRTLLNNYFQQPVQVGGYPDGASPAGALDMAGNVWEFVQDWYGRDYYAASPQNNPMGPDEGESHVIRGGSFSSSGGAGLEVMTYYRNYEGGPGNTGRVGFRCVSEP